MEEEASSGIFGDETAVALGQFQNDNGLLSDRICGKNTFSKLFR